MKKLLVSLLLLVLASFSLGVNVDLKSENHGYTIVEQTDDYLIIEYGVSAVDVEEVNIDGSKFTELSVQDGYLTREIGNPALPTFRDLLELPYGAKPEVEVLSYDRVEFSGDELDIYSPIIPAQPSYSKSTPSNEIKFIYNNSQYMEKGYQNLSLADISLSGSSRGIGVGSLVVRPFDYNPVDNSLAIYQNLRVKVSFKDKDPNFKEIKEDAYSPFFEKSNGMLINYTTPSLKSDLTTYPVSYLIVANENLNGNAKLNEFISWKEEKGFNVVTNYVSSTTSISTIDNWVESQYQNLTPKPSFLLIVGDESGTYTVKTEVNPSIGLGGSVTRSDLLYGVMGSTSSSNRIPSLYVGRFSVRSLSELTAQVDKTIWYEKGQFESNYDLSYLSNVMGTAGHDTNYQASHGNPHIRYGMTYYFNNTYVNPVTGTTNGINGIAYYDGGSGQASNIVNNVSNGLAFYNYTAHGNQTSFQDPLFSISNINSLTNDKEYPLVIGNCCLTGSFGTSESFGEAWLNVADKGAIGYIGASMSTYWDEDLAFGVGEAASGNTTPSYSPNKPGSYDGIMRKDYPTQGGMKHVGLLAVETYGGSKVNWYWSAYHLFGDPSLMVYMGVPTSQTASYGALNSTQTTFSVTTTPGAYVALSDGNGNLHGAALANSSGVASLNITPMGSTSNAKLVVSAQFKKPYFGTINVGGGSGNQAPTCEITSPANNSSFEKGSNVNIIVSATDAAKGLSMFDKELFFKDGGKSVSSVKFYVDNVLKSTDTTLPYSFSWNTSSVTVGSHTIKAVATDDENSATTETITVNIINPAPAAEQLPYSTDFSTTTGWTQISTNCTDRWSSSSTNKAGGSSPEFMAKWEQKNPATTILVSPEISTVGATALELSFKHYFDYYGSGVTIRVQSSTDKTNWSTEGWQVVNPTGNMGAETITADITNNLGGSTYIGLAIEGNLYQFDNWYIDDFSLVSKVANQAPTCAITSPANNSSFEKGAHVNIAVTATDDAKNRVMFDKELFFKNQSKSVSNVKFYVDNVLKSTDSTLPYSYSWNTATATVGSHTIKAVATDDQGSATTKSITVNITEPVQTGEELPYNTNFSTTTGWSQQSDNCSDRWSSSSTNKAGGSSPEYMAKWENKNPATTRLVSPEINTSGESTLQVSFKHYFDYYGSGVTVEVQSSSDKTNWTTEGWQVVNPTGNLGAETITANVTNNLGTTTYIGFVVKGNLYQFDNWYIDDVSITASSGGSTPVGITALDEGFENGGSMPAGWTKSNVTGSTNWTFVAGGHNSKPNGANTGSYNALLYRNSTSQNTTKLISPAMDLGGVTDATLTFYHAQAVWSPDQDELKVYYRTSSSGTWTQLAHYSSSVTSWTKRTIDLPNESGTYYLAFEGIAKYGYGVCLDDVKVVGTRNKSGVDNLPENISLSQNYPNPFNPVTTINYSLPVASDIKFMVYNNMGQMVWSRSMSRQAGNHSIEFDGREFNSGVYFYTLQTPSKTITKKMILVK